MFPRFWDNLSSYGPRNALIGDDGSELTYSELSWAIDQAATKISSRPKVLVLLEVSNNLSSILAYLSILRSGNAVILQPALRNVGPDWSFPVQVYRPDIVICSPKNLAFFKSDDFIQCEPIFGLEVLRSRLGTLPIADDIALLLSTSGSTGSPKMACISWENLASSTTQVCTTLEIGSHERAVTSLPVSFVYGLTAIHTHLAVGASLLITQRSVLDREFWSIAAARQITTFAGVPWTYQTLMKMQLCRQTCPSLVKLTQSGGMMDIATRDWITTEFADHGCNVYLMYGQTEATGRISVLPPSRIHSKRGSVGLPVVRGQFSCDADGEILYRGPNVMLGYAGSRSGLESFNPIDTLRTGDIGHIDKDGFLYITGRLSRICKLLGLRWNLDEIECTLNEIQPVAVKSDDKTIDVYVEGTPCTSLLDKVNCLLSSRGVPSYMLRTYRVPTLPRTPREKIAYDCLFPKCGKLV